MLYFPLAMLLCCPSSSQQALYTSAYQKAKNVGSAMKAALEPTVKWLRKNCTMVMRLAAAAAAAAAATAKGAFSNSNLELAHTANMTRHRGTITLMHSLLTQG